MVIVIGATGFIGLYTVEKLIQAGYEVLATGRNEVAGQILCDMGATYLHFDMTDKADLKKLPTEHVDGVILLAGLLPANSTVDIEKDENADEYIEVNVLGTIRILEHCRKNGIKKLISTSSYADVRQAWKRDYAIGEQEPRCFTYTGDHAVYVISKNAAADIAEYYNQQHGMQCATFRLPPVYGYGPHSEIYVNGKYYKTGIQTFIECAEQGKDIEIWGDPHISRDIVYVKDVADAFVKALKSDKTYGLYNMTSGKCVELEEQVRVTIDVFGGEKKASIVYRPEKQNNTPSFLFSIEKARRDFGYDPQYTSYRAMMVDYKAERDSGRWTRLVQSRKKQNGDA